MGPHHDPQATRISTVLHPSDPPPQNIEQRRCHPQMGPHLDPQATRTSIEPHPSDPCGQRVVQRSCIPQMDPHHDHQATRTSTEPHPSDRSLQPTEPRRWYLQMGRHHDPVANRTGTEPRPSAPPLQNIQQRSFHTQVGPCFVSQAVHPDTAPHTVQQCCCGSRAGTESQADCTSTRSHPTPPAWFEYFLLTLKTRLALSPMHRALHTAYDACNLTYLKQCDISDKDPGVCPTSNEDLARCNALFSTLRTGGGHSWHACHTGSTR